MIEPNAHYELYESRGREPDQGKQDWLRTEQEILTSSGKGEIASGTFYSLRAWSLA